MTSLAEYRKQYPQYDHVSDSELAGALYQKYYAGKIDRQTFDQRLGVTSGGYDFATRAANMSPADLSVARSKSDEFGQYLRDQASKPKEGETAAETFKRQYGGLSSGDVTQGEAVLRSANQGQTFGTSDNIVGAIAATADPLVNGMGGTWEERYKAYTDRERARLARGREKYPVATTTAEVAGAVPTALAIPYGVVGRLAQTGSTAAKVGAGAAIGATEGAAYGAASDDEDRSRGALIGGIGGGAVGTVAPAAAPVVRKVGNKLFPNKVGHAAKKANISKDAYKIILDAAEADDSLTGAGVRNIKQAGPDAMLVDAGPSMRNLLDSSIQSSGKAAKVANDAVNKRLASATKRVNAALNHALGAPQGSRSVARKIAQSTKSDREAAYKLAHSQAIDYATPEGRAIEEILSRIPPSKLNSAIQTANDLMRWKKLPHQIMAKVGDDGEVAFQEMPNVVQVDYIKRALGELGAENVDNFGRPTGDGVLYRDMAKSVRRALGDAVPEYDAAVRLGGDKIERDNALRLGQELLRPGMTREMVAETVDGISDHARIEAFKGLRQHIDDTLARVKRTLSDPDVDARETAQLIKDMSSRASKEKVAMLVGDEAAEKLFKEIDQAATAFDLRASVSQNSKTHVRGAIQSQVKARVDDGPVNALRSGKSYGALQSLVSNVAGRSEAAKARVMDNINADLARTLVSDPNAAQRLQDLQGSLGDVGGGVLPSKLTQLALQRNAGFTGPEYGPR